MDEYRYTKLVSQTYFKKGIEVSIDNVQEGDLVYLSIKSPLNYGIRTWEYWGMITRITPFYFYILEYCEAHRIGPNCWYTESIERMNQNKKRYAKRWSKNSIVELYSATSEAKEEMIEYHSNVLPSDMQP